MTSFNKTRILLINPPSPFLIEERVFTPTGVLYAASELEDRGYGVRVLDLSRPSQTSDKYKTYVELIDSYEKEYLDQVRNCASEFNIIGVSVTTPQYKFGVKILEAIREINPSAKTILGGAHATLISGLRNRRLAFLTANNPSGDLECLLNDFDPNFASVAKFDHIVSGGAAGIFDIIHGSTQKWIVSPKIGKNIDNIPVPARHLIDMDSYKYYLKNPRTGEQVRTTNIMSQWGCPFPCNFCSGRDDDFYRKIRQTSPEQTLAELDDVAEKYKHLGIKGFMFFDDELNIDNERFNRLLVLLKKRHIEKGYVYRGFVKSELVTERFPDTFDRMIYAGFAEVCTGVESGSANILKQVIRKNTTPEINLKSAELAHKAGISFKAFAMIGHPTETENDAMATLAWLLKARPDGFDITVHQPYPGAPVYDFAVKDDKTGLFFLTMDEVNLSKNRIFTTGSKIEDAVFYFQKPDFGCSNVDSFYKGRIGEYKSNVWTPSLSAQRIVELRDYIETEGKRILGATSVSGITYDGVMGQPAGGKKL